VRYIKLAHSERQNFSFLALKRTTVASTQIPSNTGNGARDERIFLYCSNHVIKCVNY
jgi:hypothetical protein